MFRYKGYRFFFFSREERRMHVHVESAKGEAKFWLDPIVSLADQDGFSTKELSELHRIVEVHKDEIEKAWKKHFS